MNISKAGSLHHRVSMRGENNSNAHLERHYFVLADDFLFHSANQSRTETYGEYFQLYKFNEVLVNGDDLLTFTMKSTSKNIEVIFSAETTGERDSWVETLREKIKKSKHVLELGKTTIRSKKAKQLMSQVMSEVILPSIGVNENKSTKTVYSLNVRVSEARTNKEADLYCIISADGELKRTRVINKNSKPLWAEKFDMRIIDPNTSKLLVSVWETHGYKDNIIGKCEISLNALSVNSVHEEWYPLTYTINNWFVSGKIHVRIDALMWKSQGIVIFSMIEGKNLPLRTLGPTDVYVKLVAGKQTFKTKSFRTLDRTNNINSEMSEAEWNEDFEIKVSPDEPLPDFHLEIYKPGYILGSSSSSLIGTCEIKSSNFKTSFIDEWLVLGLDLEELAKENSKSVNKEKIGDIRLLLNLSKAVVRPLEYYEPLLNLLMGTESSATSTVEIFETLAKSPDDRVNIALRLVRIYEAKNKAPVILKALLSHEVNIAPDVETLFRANSLASKAVDLYMKMSAGAYLNFCIKETVDEVYKEKKSYEINSSKIEKFEDVRKNWKAFQKIMDKLLNTIYSSVNECPNGLRNIFRHLQQEVVKKFEYDTQVRYTGVSCFLFLRFIVAAILGPKLFDIVADHPKDQRILKNLTIISRILQRIANMTPVDLNTKDAILQCEIYIELQKDRMRTFIDQLCEPVQLDTFDPASVDLTQELAFVQDFCESSLSTIYQELKDNNSHYYSDLSEMVRILDEMAKEGDFPREPLLIKSGDQWICNPDFVPNTIVNPLLSESSTGSRDSKEYANSDSSPVTKQRNSVETRDSGSIRRGTHLSTSNSSKTDINVSYKRKSRKGAVE